jgi:hypothetical protein
MAALASSESRTGDLGRRANTAQYTDAVIRAMHGRSGSIQSDLFIVTVFGLRAAVCKIRVEW